MTGTAGTYDAFREQAKPVGGEMSHSWRPSNVRSTLRSHPLRLLRANHIKSLEAGQVERVRKARL